MQIIYVDKSEVVLIFWLHLQWFYWFEVI